MGRWNGVDWVLAAVVLVSVVTAIRKGFVRELVSLASVVVGLIVAAHGHQRCAAWFEDLSRSREVALGAAFLALFLGTLVVGLIISLILGKLIKKAGLDWFNRFLGGVFGLVRGVLVDSVLLMIAVAFAIKPGLLRQSQLTPYVSAGARVIALMMPADLKAQFRSGLEKFREGVTQSNRTAAKD